MAQTGFLKHRRIFFMTLNYKIQKPSVVMTYFYKGHCYKNSTNVISTQKSPLHLSNYHDYVKRVDFTQCTKTKSEKENVTKKEKKGRQESRPTQQSMDVRYQPALFTSNHFIKGSDE